MATVALIMFIKKALFIKSPENILDCQQVVQVLNKHPPGLNNTFMSFIQLAIVLLKSQFSGDGNNEENDLIPAIDNLFNSLQSRNNEEQKNILQYDEED